MLLGYHVATPNSFGYLGWNALGQVSPIAQACRQGIGAAWGMALASLQTGAR